jgi:hypothetical protein
MSPRHEISSPHLVQSEAEEAADVADAAFDSGGIHPVRIFDGDQTGAGRRGQHGATGPADRAAQGVHHPDAAGELPGADGADPRRRDLATHQTWFGGIYQDPKNFFMQNPVVPEEFLSHASRNNPLPPEQKKAWLQTRTGAIVGRKTAERFQLENRRPGADPVFTIWAQARMAAGTWEFDIVGIL